ncbi:hypothetical protein [Solobacterium moorei]|uniref:hypothetical protein n=1 Tax=Solobacterium moorei TaxID=102148 RepID=UPI00048073A5|nr:hypothetical protein [Solobacterium moorei]BET20713.1 hypothetical protein RGT18_03010 [Solobacterium moorei]
MNVEYAVPSSLQFSNTYFHLNLGNGTYITTLPGSTFTEEFRYNFWTDQSTETINKGDTTTTLMTLIIGGKSLREAGSKTLLKLNIQVILNVFRLKKHNSIIEMVRLYLQQRVVVLRLQK